jgi:L-ascorbate metabolism protein UlaG (beta-lactamase superfamily)
MIGDERISECEPPRLTGKGPAQWTRRAVLGGSVAGIGGLALGGWLYSQSPSFWHRYAREIFRPVAPAPHTPRPKQWPAAGLHAAWIGHSTVLLSLDGFTIFTDPNFSAWAGFHFGPFALGIKREVAPALRVRDLPPIDLILLSHAHMDHFDLPSLRSLESKRTTVITPEHTVDLLRAGRYRRVVEASWGQVARVGALSVRAVQVKHWGARLRRDTYRKYNGYIIESPRFRVLFAGDTGFTDVFSRYRDSRGVDLAIMPVGCYNPYRPNHCTPEEAWKMAAEAGARRLLPIHHSTFIMSREPAAEPMERLVRIAAAERALDRIVLREIGQEFHAGG